MQPDVSLSGRRPDLTGAGGAPSEEPTGTEGHDGGTSNDALAQKPPSTHAHDDVALERVARSVVTHVPSIAEKAIWNPVIAGSRTAAQDGANVAMRGRALEVLAGNNPLQGGLGRYAKDADRMTKAAVVQIKSTAVTDPVKVAQIARDATRDAQAFVKANPGLVGTRGAQAHVILPSGTPKTVVKAAEKALEAVRKPIANALPPKVTTGLPGAVGAAGKTLTAAGTAFSAYAFEKDVERGDVERAVVDAGHFGGGALALASEAVGSAALGTAGAVLAAGAVGYEVGENVIAPLIPKSAAIAYGGAIVHGLQAVGIDLEKK